MTKYRLLIAAALLPLLVGCDSAHNPIGAPYGAGVDYNQPTGSHASRPVTNMWHNEFLTRGPGR